MNLLQSALCNLKDQITATGWFNKFYEFAEIIQRGDEFFPASYNSSGNYDRVYDFDVNGSGYIRKLADAGPSVVSGVKLTSCSDTNPLIDMTFPLRLVAAVPKKKLNDNAFSDDMLAFELIAEISKRQPAVQNIVSVIGAVRNYSTNRIHIWHQEVGGIDKQVDLNLSFIAIDFTLTFRTNLDCIKESCY